MRVAVCECHIRHLLLVLRGQPSVKVDSVVIPGWHTIIPTCAWCIKAQHKDGDTCGVGKTIRGRNWQMHDADRTGPKPMPLVGAHMLMAQSHMAAWPL